MDILQSGNINRYDNEFMKYCFPLLKSFFYYKITRKELNVIQSKVFLQLGVKNKFELKDKFEGGSYLQNITHLFKSYITISKILDIDFDLMKSSIPEISDNVILIKNKKIRIANFLFGQKLLFKYDLNWINDGIIVALHRDESNIFICGYIDRKTIFELYESRDFFNNSTRSENKIFTDFDKLIPITKIS